MLAIAKPYLLFLGDAADGLTAKTAKGVLDWRPDECLGQFRLEDCRADLGIPDMSLGDAYSRGARTLLIGVANRGGLIDDRWISVLCDAMAIGFDLASGLHARLVDIPELRESADRTGRVLHDVRHAKGPQKIGDGRKRTGRRLLPVGTDCSCGKMYTALSFEKEMMRRGIAATFRATGQTGILIAGAGVSIDAVVADFVSGAVEALAPSNDPDHWDLIEGQGSLFHPSYAGVSLGLIHGAQPDALVLCHEPTRKHMRGLPHYPIPDIADCISANLSHARLTNMHARFVGICINTSLMNDADANGYLADMEERFELPAVDPVKHGVGRIVDAM